MVDKKKVEQELSEEELQAAEAINRKRRIAKLKLAAVGVNFGKPERREIIQNSKNTKEFNQAAGENALDKGTQDRVRAEVDFINTGNKIRPPKKPIDVKLRRKLAKVKLDLEQKIAKEHGHSIVFRGHLKGKFRGASLQTQEKNYAKYFLLNAKQINGNGWGISARTARENMGKFVGRPLVITSSLWHGASLYGESFEHPYLPTNDLNQIFAHQENYRVGNIVGIDESKNGDFHAVVEMLPKFAGRRLPPFCSPAIFQLDAMEKEGDISKWEALHLAALDSDPAYGARVAILKGTCIGTEHACTVQFKSAKLKETKLLCPVNLARLKSRLAGINTNDGKKPKPVDITAFGVKKPFTQKDQKALDNISKSFNQRGFNEKDDPKKKQNLVAKLQRIAAKNVEDILRGRGRSVDGSHSQSTFLSSKGEFIGDGDTHIDQILNLDNKSNTKIKQNEDTDTEGIINNFSQENRLPRVQTFAINREGIKKTSVGINSPINQNQFKAIKDLEKGGRDIGFVVSGTEVGSGSRDLMKILRERKLLQ